MDGYRDGRDKAAAEAAAGKNRSFAPADLREAAKMLASENYRKTHAEGVRDGYRDENLRKK
jgi:hypothetical protein